MQLSMMILMLLLLLLRIVDMKINLKLTLVAMRFDEVSVELQMQEGLKLYVFSKEKDSGDVAIEIVEIQD